MVRHQFVLTIPKFSPEKFTLSVVEKQQLPDTEYTEIKYDIPCRLDKIY